MGLWDRMRSWLQGGEFRSASNDVQEAPTSGGGSGGGGAKRDPAQTAIKRIGLALGDDLGRDFNPPEFNLVDITNAYNTEAYVRQAVDKYIELMFKAGWDIVGKNPNAVDYIRMRLHMMAEVTGLPNDQLFIEIAEDLVKYSNAVVVKARAKDVNSLPPGVTVQGLGGAQPIAGYFPLNVTTMSVRRDKNGTVKGWQQEVEGQDKPVKFKPEDIVHIYYKREKGNGFGTPFLMPVLDDIRALRQAEENVLKLIYRNLFPYIHVQVGLPEEGLGATDPEIQRTQRDIEMMDLEAGLVTSERVNIKPIANDKIIDANPYLKYFEQRVFTGLGVSELMMGRGNTANRSTGDNLSGEFTDRVKAFQKVMSIFVDDFIIKELLMEGGFDPILNPDDNVDFVFKEIDIDAKIKAENHAIFQYEHNAISEDEMRTLLGRDPIEDGDVRNKMHLAVITIGTAAAMAQFAPKQDAAAAGGAASADKKKAATDNKNKPTNQSGTKTSPKKESQDTEYQQKYYKAIEDSLVILNEGVNVLIRRHYNGEEHALHELSGVIAYTEQRVVEITREFISEEESSKLRPTLKRTFTYLHDSLAEGIQGYAGNDAAERAQETANAVFMVLNDRFTDIAEKVITEFLEGGE
jgi:hypothetical protein